MVFNGILSWIFNGGLTILKHFNYIMVSNLKPTSLTSVRLSNVWAGGWPALLGLEETCGRSAERRSGWSMVGDARGKGWSWLPWADFFGSSHFVGWFHGWFHGWKRSQCWKPPTASGASVGARCWVHSMCFEVKIGSQEIIAWYQPKLRQHAILWVLAFKISFG